MKFLKNIWTMVLEARIVFALRVQRNMKYLDWKFTCHISMVAKTCISYNGNGLEFQLKHHIFNITNL